jgi:mono/diheme cytochrome c family protein
MMAKDYLGPLLAFALSFSGRGAVALSADDQHFFEDQVRPILEQSCFECHSHQSGKMKNGLTLDSRDGWVNGGDAGPALIPGDPDKSLLIKAIRRTDPNLEMPPKKKLSDGEIAILEQWVKRGAPDPRITATANAGMESKKDWWSLKPLKRPSVPKGANNPIDAFIAAKLRERGITPAPEADRRTLIRRLYFDLIGLLPSPEEVERFERDRRPKAYEQLVDSLLASPRYGERWARHWLDTIHYADTHGFEHDLIRTNAWRYRDYVIDSLNQDTPWPRLIREQLAADVFYPEEPRLTVALGFIAAGPFDHSTAQTAPKTFDYLDRDDIVTQTMSTFASVTVNCARCHDHKFDPITQEDYYGLQAVFAGVGKGDVMFDQEPARGKERRDWEQLLQAAEKADPAILENTTNQTRVAQWEAEHRSEAHWKVLRPDSMQADKGTTLKLWEDGVIFASGALPEKDTYSIIANPPKEPITAVRLELFPDPSLPKNGPGRQDNGNMHLSEFVIQVVQSNTNTQSKKVSLRRASADFNQSGWAIDQAIDDKEETAWGIHPQEGEAHTAVFELENALVLTNEEQLSIQLKQLHGEHHLIGKLRLSVTSDTPETAVVLPGIVAKGLELPRENRTELQQREIAFYALKIIAKKHLESMPPPKVVFAAAPNFTPVISGNFYSAWQKPKVIYVLRRGDLEKPGAAASPGALAAISELAGRFELKHPDDEGARRAALADWLANPKNPLTWRSIVNRIWHYHFDRGIADSPNDLGHMGAPPSHPELLDWLACEFRDNGGSLKALHRLIVTSATYRRSSQYNQSSIAKDPDDRLLWRRQSRRLDAEAYRDEVLAISGHLDLTMGGPGVKQFQMGKPIQLTPTVDYGPFDWGSPGAGRRSIYRFLFRGLQDPFMDALDFPDGAQLAPTRPFSASALQALALLNDDFVLYHSDRLAERLAKESTSTRKQIQTAFLLIFQRKPTKEETTDFAAYAESDGLPAMCRMLLNSNEFLFVN